MGSEEIKELVHLEVEQVISTQADRLVRDVTQRIGQAVASSSRERAEYILTNLLGERKNWHAEAAHEASIDPDATNAGGRVDRSHCQRLNNSVSMNIRHVFRMLTGISDTSPRQV